MSPDSMLSAFKSCCDGKIVFLLDLLIILKVHNYKHAIQDKL